MKFIRFAAEYVLVVGIEALIGLLPRRMAILLGNALGSLLSFLLSSRRQLIDRNLASAFPEKSVAERDSIARGMWRNIGRTAVEFVRLKKMARQGFDNFVTWEGGEHLEAAVQKNNGVVLLTAHFCNWELTGIFIQHRFKKMMVIYRAMKNPLVNSWILAKRSMSGLIFTPHREAVRASLRWLKNKNIIGVLVDQNLYTGGIFAPFFGRPAATTTFPALLNMRTGAPILLTYTLREPGGKFRLVVEPPIEWTTASTPDEQVRLITEAVNQRVENLIRRHPDLWFWIHNRWKRQPVPATV